MQYFETKTIGSSGQISLGKQHAGKTVTVEEVENGIWMIKTAQVIPDSEMYLHTEPYASRWTESVAWLAANPPQETDLKALRQQLEALDQHPPKRSR
jgi:hypothetical protein